MRRLILFSGWLVALISGVLLWQPVAAQDGSSTVEPSKYDEPARVEGGNAVWSVEDVVFTSSYPDGFRFEGKANSTAGELVSVSVYFSFNPDWKEDTRQRGEVDPTTGAIKVVVEGRNADNIPPWVEVNFRWRISDSAGTVYWSVWYTGNDYTDSTHNWTRHESNEVLIFIQEGFPQQAIDFSFEAMAAVQPRYEEAFGRPLSYKPRMILFADDATWEEWQSFELVWRPYAGFANSYWGAFVQKLTSEGPYGLAYRVVVHEIAHLYQFDVYDFRAPAWWNEGNAGYFEIAPSYNYTQRVRNVMASYPVPSLLDAPPSNPVDNGPDGYFRWGYDLGYAFNEWLIETYGWEVHRQLVERLGEPETLPGYLVEDYFKETLEVILGMTTADIEAAWREWLGVDSIPPTLIPTPTFEYRFPPSPTPFGQ